MNKIKQEILTESRIREIVREEITRYVREEAEFMTDGMNLMHATYQREKKKLNNG